MGVTDEMVAIALKTLPYACCLVPEKREELTTEGGLDVVSNLKRMQWACDALNNAGIEVSLFIDPELAQIDAAVKVGASVVELHTGCYADAKNPQQQRDELERLKIAASYANSAGLQVNAGHGLNFYNVAAICAIQEIVELNIGHAIISQALFSGLALAVKDLKHIMRQARAEAYYLSNIK